MRVAPHARPEVVYNLHVEGTARYLVGACGVVVHNSPCSDAAEGAGGSIYKVPGTSTSSGKPYIGRHNKPDPKRTRSSDDGRDRTQAEVIDTYHPSDVMEGRVKEQAAIDAHGGVDALDNRRNEIRKRRQ